MYGLYYLPYNRPVVVVVCIIDFVTSSFLPYLVNMSQTVTITRPLSLAVNDDEIYTIDELIKRRAKELGNSTIIGYPKNDVADYEEHSARTLDRFADAAAELLQRRGLKPVVS